MSTNACFFIPRIYGHGLLEIAALIHCTPAMDPSLGTLSRLPPEIREAVFAAALLQEYGTCKLERYPRTSYVPLLGVSRAIRAEASYPYFRTNAWDLYSVRDVNVGAVPMTLRCKIGGTYYLPDTSHYSGGVYLNDSSRLFRHLRVVPNMRANIPLHLSVSRLNVEMPSMVLAIINKRPSVKHEGPCPFCSPSSWPESEYIEILSASQIDSMHGRMDRWHASHDKDIAALELEIFHGLSISPLGFSANDLREVAANFNERALWIMRWMACEARTTEAYGRVLKYSNQLPVWLESWMSKLRQHWASRFAAG